MKVKVRWRNRNPFVDMNNLTKVSEADVPNNTDYKQVEIWAKEATPEGFFLSEVDLPDQHWEYDIYGNVK